MIELPLPWSLSSAESFARGGVGLLGAAGVIDALSFGSESGDLSALEKTAAVLDTPEFAEALKRELTGGTPFAAARAKTRHCALACPWRGAAKHIRQGGGTMESGTIICNCKQVSYGQIENVVREEKNISNVVQVFDDVQKQTHCSTGCGGCHDKIMDIIADLLYQR